MIGQSVSSESLLLTPNWEEWLMGHTAIPEAPKQAGEMMKMRNNGNLLKFIKVKCKVLHLARNNSMYQYIPETGQPESSLAEKDLVVLLDTRLNISQQRALSAKQVDGCIRQNTAIRSREGILPPCSTLTRPCLVSFVQF